MKVTRQHLRQIIKEELSKINEFSSGEEHRERQPPWPRWLHEKAKKISMTKGKTAAMYDESGPWIDVYLAGVWLQRFEDGGFIIGSPDSFAFAEELRRRKIKWVLTEVGLGEGLDGGESVEDYINFATVDDPTPLQDLRSR